MRDKQEIRKKRISEMLEELKYFRKNWESMTDLEFDLWVYRLVIMYGCYYLKNTALNIVDILNNDTIDKKEKYRRIDECFSREAKIISKHKVSL